MAELNRSTRAASTVSIVGGDASDLGKTTKRRTALLTADRYGTTRQRNFGIDYLQQGGYLGDDDIVVFFDDDFRPHPDWLAKAEKVFSCHPDIAGITGEVIMDGARTGPISETDAAIALSAVKETSEAVVGTASLYGCNMAVRATVFKTCSFDERLPLYGWLEDLDFSGQVKDFGQIVQARGCIGVHLASRKERSDGLQYGYSQIANPLYLARKGTCSRATALKLVGRALVSNGLRSSRSHPLFDYRGRLKGNLKALWELLFGNVDPDAVLNL